MRGPGYFGVVLLFLCLRQASAQELPHRIAWRGTLTDEQGRTGDFRVRTRLLEGRDIGPDFIGPIRCRGDGCPTHRGHFDAIPRDGVPDGIEEVFLSHRRVYCTY